MRFLKHNTSRYSIGVFLHDTTNFIVTDPTKWPCDCGQFISSISVLINVYSLLFHRLKKVVWILLEKIYVLKGKFSKITFSGAINKSSSFWKYTNWRSGHVSNETVINRVRINIYKCKFIQCSTSHKIALSGLTDKYPLYSICGALNTMNTSASPSMIS